jgi:hypothetical protein
VLAELPTFTLVSWGLATLLTLILICQILLLRQYAVYPVFSSYLGVNLLQTAVGIWLYQWYGFGTITAYLIAWSTQSFVIVARALAATEACYLVLGRFKGIWALAARILIACGGIVLLSSIYFGARSYQLAVITLEIGLEAAIATGIVGLLVFARYYQVRIAPATGLLGLGLGLFSCCKLLNDLVFERYIKTYAILWNHVSSFAYVAILLLWIWALRRPVAPDDSEPPLNTESVYPTLIPKVNKRLLELNDQLARIWGRKKPPEP